MNFKEVEVRFLEIDKADLVSKLQSLGAQDKGELLLKEWIFYIDGVCMKGNCFIRIRQSGDDIELTYKKYNLENRENNTLDDVHEIDLKINSVDHGRELLKQFGFVESRIQEKRRHTFLLDNVVIDIDQWPNVPVYLEIEGQSEQSIKDAAVKLGFDWNSAYFKSAGDIIEEIYKIPVSGYKWFTFDRSGD